MIANEEYIKKIRPTWLTITKTVKYKFIFDIFLNQLNTVFFYLGNSFTKL